MWRIQYNVSKMKVSTCEELVFWWGDKINKGTITICHVIIHAMMTKPGEKAMMVIKFKMGRGWGEGWPV